MANNGHWQKHWLARMGLFAETYLAFCKFFNLPGRTKRNVAHHYDLKDSLFDQFLTHAVNILAAISIPPVTRLPMRKLPNWRALGQSCVYSQIRRFWILAVGGAGLPMRYGECNRIFQ